MRIRDLKLNLVPALALIVALPSIAAAGWQWVDEPEVRVETETVQTYTQPRGPAYYQQEQVIVAPAPPVVTHREVFYDGPCEITRSYYSDGNSTDDRVCTRTRVLLPHEFLIDRMGRHFDRLRGYDRGARVYEERF